MYNFQLCVLGSGSKGNCTYYEPYGDGHGFLIDIGFPDRRIEHGLACINKSMDNVHDVLISHEHGDHLPKNKAGVYGVEASFDNKRDYTFIPTNKTIQVQSRTFIERFPLIHDTKCYGFVIESIDGTKRAIDGTKVAHITDTGDIPCEALRYLVGLHALVIEANWDELLMDDMIDDENVPDSRVQHSMDDHFSNQQMADLVETVAWDGLEYVILIHLSESNNTPELASQATEHALGNFSVKKGGQCRVVVSSQDQATPLIILKGE